MKDTSYERTRVYDGETRTFTVPRIDITEEMNNGFFPNFGRNIIPFASVEWDHCWSDDRSDPHDLALPVMIFHVQEDVPLYNHDFQRIYETFDLFDTYVSAEVQDGVTYLLILGHTQMKREDIEEIVRSFS